MTRSRRILAALGMLLVFALAGCVRFQTELTVSPDNTLDGDIVVAVITDDSAGSADKARDAAADIEAQLLPGLRGTDGVTAEPYTDDDYVGTRFTLDDTPIDAFAGGQDDNALVLTRSGERFLFSGVLDFTPGDEQEEQTVPGDPADADIRVTMHFPGEVLSHNGEVDGTTVTWTTSLEGSIEMRATASADPASAPFSVPHLLIVLGVILLPLIVIAIVVVLIVRSRRRAD